MMASDSHITGQTSFIRHAHFYSEFLPHLEANIPKHKEIELLIAPGSVGYEAFYAAHLLDELFGEKNRTKIYTVDISGDFTAAATTHVCPRAASNSVSKEKRPKIFTEIDDHDFVGIAPNVTRNVTILPAQNITDLSTKRSFDAVCCFNLLQHINWRGFHFLTREEQEKLRYQEFRKFADAINFSEIEPIMAALCGMADTYLCINKLNDTPYLPHYQKGKQGYFKSKGFNSVIDTEGSNAPIEMLNKSDDTSADIFYHRAGRLIFSKN